MKINYKNITIILVAYHSNFEIEKILKKINPTVKIIIVENSNLVSTKKYFERKYKNIKVILSKINGGQTGGINLGFRHTKSKYCLYIDMDVNFDPKIIDDFYSTAEMLDNFAILAPEHHLRSYPKKFELGAVMRNGLQKMRIVHGHFLFFNMNAVAKIGYYDENIFFYYDETDYCMRAIKKKFNIFLLKKIKVKHKDGKSYKEFNYQIEFLRHWHLMWGKFYFNKKHFGFTKAAVVTFPDLIESLFKMTILFFVNKNKFLIYQNRLFGLINAMINRPSWKRP